MGAVSIEAGVVERIIDLAAAARPNEMSALLAAAPDGTIVEVRPLAGTHTPTSSQPCHSSVEELTNAASDAGDHVVGFLHSHLLGPAAPSPADRLALDDLVHLVCAFPGGQPSVRAWQRDASGILRERPIDLVTLDALA